jgi:hypothetical protein
MRCLVDPSVCLKALLWYVLTWLNLRWLKGAHSAR